MHARMLVHLACTLVLVCDVHETFVQRRVSISSVRVENCASDAIEDIDSHLLLRTVPHAALHWSVPRRTRLAFLALGPQAAP